MTLNQRSIYPMYVRACVCAVVWNVNKSHSRIYLLSINKSTEIKRFSRSSFKQYISSCARQHTKYADRMHNNRTNKIFDNILCTLYYSIGVVCVHLPSCHHYGFKFIHSPLDINIFAQRQNERVQQSVLHTTHRKKNNNIKHNDRIERLQNVLAAKVEW